MLSDTFACQFRRALLCALPTVLDGLLTGRAGLSVMLGYVIDN